MKATSEKTITRDVKIVMKPTEEVTETVGLKLTLELSRDEVLLFRKLTMRNDSVASFVYRTNTYDASFVGSLSTGGPAGQSYLTHLPGSDEQKLANLISAIGSKLWV